MPAFDLSLSNNWPTENNNFFTILNEWLSQALHQPISVIRFISRTCVSVYERSPVPHILVLLLNHTEQQQQLK